ncbi:unnamed protein product [Allacma fusca]|uniref:DUF1772 domain-containing protein n=1 Tax=Allacma fusca TaxID=39272 RepID=A0A8J2KMF9_9HEXA|nr:unnamed protein product [Allacma fusca]
MNVPDKVLQGIFLGTAGAFAGMGVTLNLAAVPALLASSDPVPAWRVVYNRGKNFAFLTILPSTAAALALYSNTGVKQYLACAALNVTIIPFTLFFMKPTNDALHKFKKSDSSKTEKELITTWGGLQMVRTTLSAAAFVIGIYTVLKH